MELAQEEEPPMNGGARGWVCVHLLVCRLGIARKATELTPRCRLPREQ